MPNQFTKAIEEGREPPKASNQFIKGTRTEHDPQTKAKIRAAFAADKLEAYLNGEEELDSTKVAACKILIDKGLPSLQAVESTEVNQFDKMSEDELREQVRALITLHPWLIREFAPGPQLDSTPESTATNVVDEQQVANG